MRGNNSVPTSTRQASRRTHRSRLVGRLASLRNAEGANIILFWFLFVLAWSNAALPSTWGFRTYALGIATVILAEGGYYWHLKLRSVRSKRALSASFRRTFTRLRTLNLVLLGTSLPIAVLLYGVGASSALDLIMGSLLAVFAGLEHVNYFHVQLMHDSRNDWTYLWRNRRLRRAPLAEDLEQPAKLLLRDS